MPKRPKFRREIKRGRICAWPEGVGTPDEVAARVTYTGSALHKSYPSPAGPPALRADRQAISARCVGSFRGGFPSRAWVWINGVLHEARLTGAGDYHGFPINDPRQYPEPQVRLEEAPRVQIPVN
jgi:hypothetical protein